MNEINKLKKEIDNVMEKIKLNPNDKSLKWYLFHLETRLEQLEMFRK